MHTVCAFVSISTAGATGLATGAAADDLGRPLGRGAQSGDVLLERAFDGARPRRR
jgi:hypothetical protein